MKRPTIAEVRLVLDTLESYRDACGLDDPFENSEEVNGMMVALRFVTEGRWSVALDQAWNTAREGSS